ncbi:MAG TPA: hypothetical protein VM120_07040 [Bryobacteraceae bacterium]|nr:hypothetical protein [Bryobacteraceae bacterium]
MSGNCDQLIHAIITPATAPNPGAPTKPGLEQEIMRTLEAFPEARAAVYITIERFLDHP